MALSMILCNIVTSFSTWKTNLNKKEKTQEDKPKKEENNLDKKRQNYISWDDYFMGVAFLSGMRSKDPSTQVGACIVNKKNRIVATGYNGMPNGISDDDLSWARDRTKYPSQLDRKYPYVCHAEMNAIVNKNSASVKDCSIYVSLFPCNECAKLIIQSGIKQIYYYSDKHNYKDETKASKKMLEKAKIECKQVIPNNNEPIQIDFKSIHERHPNLQQNPGAEREKQL